MRLDGALRAAPALTALLMVGPIAAGLLGAVVPAIAGRGFADLFAWPGISRAVTLSLTTGISSTLASLAIVLFLFASLQGSRLFSFIARSISPLLGFPHAAAALGLAFLVSPSGWIARILSPWATGWMEPPDLLILNDPNGIALTLGLVIKEVPFLLLMVLAALPQVDAKRRLDLSASLGYGRVSGWFLAVLPAIWPQIRLPGYAVLAYAMTTVDMAMILGPTLPPTLSVQVTNWMMHPDFGFRSTAAAGALLQLALVAMAILAFRVLEWLLARGCAAFSFSGRRATGLDTPLAFLSAGFGIIVIGLASAGILGMAIWSIAGPWQFPDSFPSTLTLGTWRGAAEGLSEIGLTSLALGGLSTSVALILVLACLEAEFRFGLQPGKGAQILIYLPLIVPQIAFIPGLQVLCLLSGTQGSLVTVAAAHLVFVLPYVFLAAGPAWRAWDRRVALAGFSLGATPARVLFRLRLPMLLRALLTTFAVGFAVSLGQYLPTLLIGGGRVTSLTTEAVALSSGGNRRIIGTYAIAQIVLPMLGFLVAAGLPAFLFRNRAGLRVPG